MTFRTFLVLGFLGLFLVFSMPLHLVVWLIGKKNPTKKWSISHKVIHWAFESCIFFNSVKLEVINHDVIPDNEPVLFTPNHRSYWDILCVHNAIKKPVGFVAKIEMYKYPFLKWWMQDIGCIFLDRDNPREGLKTIKQGAEYLKLGHNMVLCPEGTRNQKDEMLPFKEGSLKMAEKSGCKVIPVAIIGTDDLMENLGKFRMKKGPVKIIFGEPINLKTDIPEEYKKRSAAYVQTKVQAMLDEYRN